MNRLASLAAATCLAGALSIHSAHAGPFVTLLETKNTMISNKVLVGTLDTFNDLINTNFSSSAAATWVPPGAWDITAMAYDGQFRFLMEVNQTGFSPEVFAVTAATYDDIVMTNLSSANSTWVVPGAYNIVGLAYDGQYRVILERVINIMAPAIILGTAATWDDIVMTNLSNDGSSTFVVPAGYKIAGLSYDGQYRLLLEETVLNNPLGDVRVVTFNTYNDLLAGNVAGNQAATWVPPTAYDIAGLAYVPSASIPEPGTLALFGLGLAGLGFIRRRKAM